MSAQRDYLSLPMRAFLTDLAARSPTPGGGSLAALLGALAASQAQMVIAYTLGKKKHNDELFCLFLSLWCKFTRITSSEGMGTVSDDQ